MSARADLGFLAAAFVFALALRVGITEAFVGLDAAPDADSNPDQIDYEEFAFQLAEGHGYQLPNGNPTARRPPGTSLALLPVYATLGRHHLAGRLWFCTLSALSVALAGAWIGRCFGRGAGRWTALLLALYPGHFYYSMHFLSEPVFGLWTVLFCSISLAALRAPPGRGGFMAGVAGLCLGLSILTRPQALLMIPVAGLLLLAIPSLRRPRLWARSAIVVGTAALILAPWVVRNHRVMGKATISTIGGCTFWGANNATIDGRADRRGSWMPINSLIDEQHPVEGSEVEQEAATWSYGKAYLRKHPERVPGLLAMKLVRLVSPFRDTPNRAVYWAFALAWIAAAPWVLGGLIVAWRRDRGACTLMLLPIAAMIGTALVFYGSTRFRDSICVVLIAFAGIALSALQERLRARMIGA